MKFTSMVAAALVAVLLLLPKISFAQTADGSTDPQEEALIDELLIDDPLLVAADDQSVEKTDTTFEVSGFSTGRITLVSSETITLRLEAAETMIELHLGQADGPVTTRLTLTGLSPSTAYYKYEDDYNQLEVLTTDDQGGCSWDQDISGSHFVFLQTRKSTKFIRANSTGGDCASIGTWNEATLTCTLTIDLNETVQIDSDNITLDGNGHTITGYGTGYGVNISDKTNVTLKNVTVKNFSDGIRLSNAEASIISNNTSSGNSNWGIYAWCPWIGCDSTSLLNNNTAFNTRGGFYIYHYRASLIKGNTSTSDKGVGFKVKLIEQSAVEANTATKCKLGMLVENVNYYLGGTVFKNNVLSENRIGLNISSSFSYDTFSNNMIQENSEHDLVFNYMYEVNFNNNISNPGLYEYAGGGDCTVTIENTTGSGGRPIKYFNSPVVLQNETLAELILCNADDSVIANVTIAGSDTYKNNGVFLFNTDRATLTGITSSENVFGIFSRSGSGNTIQNSTFTGNFIGVRTADEGHAIKGNTFTDDDYGVILGGNNNRIYNNNFIASKTSTNKMKVSGAGNLFSLPPPVGGNYWSRYDSPSEGCNDLNLDGFCDASYNKLTGVRDDYPWTIQDGWSAAQDTTPPSSELAFQGTGGDNGWYRSDVQVALLATDDESGTGVKEIRYVLDNGAETVVAGSSAAIALTTDGEHSIAYYAVDNAGNSEVTHSLSIKIDKSLPTISAAQAPAANSFGWNNADVTVAYTCDDATSGVATCASPETAATEGAGQTFSGSAADNAGNTAIAALTLNIDKTAPTITASAAPAANANGWNNEDVTISFACADALSGLASCPTPVSVTAEGANQAGDGTAVDKAGNAAAASMVLNIDKTPPAITISGVTNGATYSLGAAPTPGYSVADELSGVKDRNATLTGGNANSVGAYTYAVTASDLAGNSIASTAAYSVVYTFSGFLAPISLDRPFKLGSTIPVKFQLTDSAGTHIATAAATIMARKYSDNQPVGEPIEVTSTSGADTGNAFRYSGADNQYIYNLSTSGLTEGAWQILATLDDGTVKTIVISLKTN